MIPVLREREHSQERLDDLTVSGPDLERVLGELAWLNQKLGDTRRIVAAVQSLDLPEQPCIVDVGCGAGDLLAALRQALPTARLVGIDGNPAVLEVASARVDAEMEHADVMAPGYRLPDCDVAVSTHFLYHFDSAALTAFLARNPDRTWVIGELRRSALAHVLFGSLGPLFLSEWTIEDGLRAIRRAFTPSELRDVVGPRFDVRVSGFSMVAVGRPSTRYDVDSEL